MATLLWGNVYYQNQFAGVLREEAGGRMAFIYDANYLNSNFPPLAFTLPLQEKPHISQMGLPPFFDNLVAEGWLEQAQSRLLGKRSVSRFELLLAFGTDCAGAVSVVDAEPSSLTEAMLDLDDSKQMAVLASRASLSGVQPKLALIEIQGKLRPSKMNELSTHIGKFPSLDHNNIVVNEFLTTLAFKELLDDDEVVDIKIGEIEGMNETALIIKRFDRTVDGRIHFEEFNQLLGLYSHAKYNGSYKDMANFIRNNPACLPTDTYKLFMRIVAGILLGNTDMHFKNFAMLHTNTGLRLTPTYDQVAAALYNYKTMALAIGGTADLQIGNLKAANIIKLADEFGLSRAITEMAAKQLDKNRDAAKEAIQQATFGTQKLKDDIIQLMDKRWKGTFALIGQALSKKQ
jgi:serine/threonine-protein kinase HipA